IVGENDAPTDVSAGGPYTVVEGGSVTLAGSFNDVDASDTHTFSWDVNGDGVFGDATGLNPTLSWAELQALMPAINDGPATFQVSLRVDDGTVAVDSAATATLEVENAPPTADVTGPTSGVLGFPIDFDLSALDPSAADQAAGFTYTINWGDGSPVEMVNGGSPLTVSHSFTNFGSV